MVQTVQNQLNNRLNTDKFKLVFREVQNTELLGTAVSLPSVSGIGIEVPNPHNKLFVQGKKLNYGDFTIRFQVDEDLKNYKEILAWMMGIYAPQSYQQFADFMESSQFARISKSDRRVGFDASLFTLKNSMNVNFEINFIHLFPTALGGLQFETTNSEMVTAEATFQYDYFLFR
jgi:hypothetical protein